MHGPTWSVTELSCRLAVLAAAPFIGSFLGVLIWRLPQGRPVVLARSVCEHCGVTLGVRDLVPLASYVWQRGRCRACGAAIAPFHPVVELAAVGVAGWAVLAEPDVGRLWADCALAWSLLALGWVDWCWMLLPDALTLPLLLAGLGLTLAVEPAALADHAAGAIAGYVGLRGVALCYRAVRGREGIGAGDAKLLAAAGAWLGLAALPLVVLIAALLGLALAGGLALSGRKLRATTALPFGVCLAAALWLVWLHGNGIIEVGGMAWPV